MDGFRPERLRAIRLAHGLGQEDLAARSGVAQNTISEAETGRRTPRPSTLRKFAAALGVEVGDFFEAADSPKAPPDVEGYLRYIGAELSALSSEDFSQELVNRSQEEGGLTRLVAELRAEVEIASMEWEADRQNQLKRAALRRARNGRYVTAIAFRSVRKYAIGAFPEEEKKIAELAKLAKELEREGREREMAGAA